MMVAQAQKITLQLMYMINNQKRDHLLSRTSTLQRPHFIITTTPMTVAPRRLIGVDTRSFYGEDLLLRFLYCYGANLQDSSGHSNCERHGTYILIS